MENTDNTLIPVEKVIDDMYSDNFYADSARDYYYVHYATEDERRWIDNQKRRENIAGFCFLSTFLLLIIIGLLFG